MRAHRDLRERGEREKAADTADNACDGTRHKAALDVQEKLLRHQRACVCVCVCVCVCDVHIRLHGVLVHVYY